MVKAAPKIIDCIMSDCSYNRNKACHATAVTVGGPHPKCDTFLKAPRKGGVKKAGVVGACKITECCYNESFECSASGIHMGIHQNHADCSTYLRQTIYSGFIRTGAYAA